MASADISTRNFPSDDHMDDSLFDYDVGDMFRNVDTNIDMPAVRADGNETSAGLGIDEEIKVTKKRAPVPRLDENRLLSSAGIPRLRRVAKERLKFKGKGHEYSDVARLLNAYQLWLDDLYPRAKFADGLAIIEKLGHSKRMQTMRREWICEGKLRENLGILGEGAEKLVGQQNSGQDQSWEVKSRERSRTPIATVGDDDDLYTTTPKSARDDERTRANVEKGGLSLEHSPKTVPVLGQEWGSPAREDDFNDDEEALLALNDVW